MLNILKSNGQRREEHYKAEEQAAEKELKEFVEEFQERYNVSIVPSVIVGISPNGMTPITSNLKVVSNKRFKK